MSGKKKILHLITGLEVGGAEMMLLKTLPKMQNDFDNYVCTLLKDGLIGAKLREAGIITYHLDFSLSNSLRSILLFRRIIKDFKPDILVTYLIHSDLFGRIFGRIFGIQKIICSQRGSLQQWEFLRFFDKLTKSLVTKYIVQTEVAKKELMTKLNLPEKKFEVIPNAIDVSEYEFKLDTNAKKKGLRINPDNQTIVCVSNLHKGKGHKYLLEAFEKVYKKNKNVNLLIVGDGEQRTTLEKQTKDYVSRDNIYFLGKRNDVKEILKISDIFVLATEGEGMSNAIMEAMASGIPVITTDIPENRVLIENEKTGFFVLTKNSVVLTKKIEKLLNNKQQKETIGRNAKYRIRECFDINIITSKLAHFFNSL